MFRLYARVLGLLGPQMRLGWLLALANVALAAAQLAEPVLFGRIIDALAGAQGAGGALDWPSSRRCSPPGSASGCSSSSAARWSRSTPTSSRTGAARPCCPDYFEHVLQLPLELPRRHPFRAG